MYEIFYGGLYEHLQELISVLVAILAAIKIIDLIIVYVLKILVNVSRLVVIIVGIKKLKGLRVRGELQKPPQQVIVHCGVNRNIVDCSVTPCLC